MRRRLEAVQRSGGENWGNNNWEELGIIGNNNWEECSTEHWGGCPPPTMSFVQINISVAVQKAVLGIQIYETWRIHSENW